MPQDLFKFALIIYTWVILQCLYYWLQLQLYLGPGLGWGCGIPMQRTSASRFRSTDLV